MEKLILKRNQFLVICNLARPVVQATGTEEDDIRLKTCLPKHLTEQYPVSKIATTERDGSKSDRVGTSMHKDLGSSYSNRLIFYIS